MNEDAAEAPAHASKVSQARCWDVGSAWEVSGRVEKRGSAVEGMNDVVDGAALLLLAVRCAEVHPVISIHGVARLRPRLSIAFLLQRRQPWRGEVEHDSPVVGGCEPPTSSITIHGAYYPPELLVDPDISVNSLWLLVWKKGIVVFRFALLQRRSFFGKRPRDLARGLGQSDNALNVVRILTDQ